MATPPVPVIDAGGITKPAFSEAYTYFSDAYKSIFGLDIYIDPDSQDGQDLGIRATAFDVTGSALVAVYNSFRPDYAQGAGLDTVVKINGIKRKIPSYSTADVRVIGEAGTVIVGGVATDANGYLWALPDRVVIERTGETLVTATCTTPGAIEAPAETITGINTVSNVLGWQEVTNPAAASPGLPVETDAELRARQTLSTEQPSQAVTDGLRGALAAVAGVRDLRIYENDTYATDEYGIPRNCIAAVVEGGNGQDIVDTIRLKKTQGVATFGSISLASQDSAGVDRIIYYSRPQYVVISWYVTLTAKAGFTLDIQKQMAQALSDWTNSVGIGNDVVLPEAMIPLQLYGAAAMNTFRVNSLLVARDGIQGSSSDVKIAYNERPYCTPDYIYFIVRG